MNLHYLALYFHAWFPNCTNAHMISPELHCHHLLHKASDEQESSPVGLVQPTRADYTCMLQ